MNKKVFISMLILTLSFLVSLYVAKIFFPQEFVMSIQNEQLIKIGAYVDRHEWLALIATSITSFVVYWFYLCAVSHKLYLNLKEVSMVIISITIMQLSYYFAPQFMDLINISSMLIIPCFMNAKLKDVAIVYSVHGLAQILSLSIRSLAMYLVGVNSLTCLLLTIECYLWLILFYVIFNYKKKEN